MTLEHVPAAWSAWSRWPHTLRLAVVLVALLPSGCASGRFVRLRPERHVPLRERMGLVSFESPRLVTEVVGFVREHGLSPRAALPLLTEHVARVQRRNPSPEGLRALAELNYVRAERLRRRDPASAAELFHDAARDSWRYLAQRWPRGGIEQRVPTTIGPVVELYNSAVEQCLRLARANGKPLPGYTLRLPVTERKLRVAAMSGPATWDGRDIADFRFVSDYELKGLKRRYTRQGIGVPLIGIRRNNSRSRAAEEYYADDLSFPVTAVLRFDAVDDDSIPILEFHDGFTTDTVRLGADRVPLAGDLSVPLAWYLDNPKLRHLDTIGLFRPRETRALAGLYMMQPYDPDRIPVLMVHGLWSSPTTWMEMFNELQAVPEFRERYQFWFYLYPTGEPFWTSAAHLREELAQLHDTFATVGGRSNLGRMVVVGHSMGGLIARMLTIESGESFWNTVSDRSIDRLRMTPESRAEIERVYYFEPVDSVARVITIASPWGGSSFANRFTRWLAEKVISFPVRTLGAVAQVMKGNPHDFRHRTPYLERTSVDGLSPRSPILRVMMERPQAPGVRFHNIVATRDRWPIRGRSDGLVSVDSARLDDVDSELVVDAHHSSVQRHPETIQEVVRILRMHLKETAAKPAYDVIPVRGAFPSTMRQRGRRRPEDRVRRRHQPPLHGAAS